MLCINSTMQTIKYPIPNSGLKTHDPRLSIFVPDDVPHENTRCRHAYGKVAVPINLTNSIDKFLSMGLPEEFNAYRSRMNEKIMASDSLIIKRIFNLDTNAYQEGSLDLKTKEMIGLTCSLVLRCDD